MKFIFVTLMFVAVQSADVTQLKTSVLSSRVETNRLCSEYCALTTAGPCQHPMPEDETCAKQVQVFNGTDATYDLMCPTGTIFCGDMPQRLNGTAADPAGPADPTATASATATATASATASATATASASASAAGWTPIMQISDDDVFQYSSSHWETTSVFNDGANIKYAAFNTRPFSSVKGCVVETNECVEFDLDRTYANAIDLFNGPARENYGIDQLAFDRVTGLSGRQNCEPSWSGFNVDCRDNNKVRWGYCVNLPNQPCQRLGDSDGAVGFGLNGQDCCNMGSGYTNYAVWNSPNAGHERRVHSILYVK